MINKTKIEWTDFTVNFWEGCQKVGPRVFPSSLSDIFDKAVDPEWRREALKEIEAARDVRIQLLTKRVGNVFQMIPADWASSQLRGWPEHVGLMITVVNQQEGNRDIPKLLDLKARLGIPWVGLSIEPMLGPVNLEKVMRIEGGNCFVDDVLTGFRAHKCGGHTDPMYAVDWVVCGGESGHQARPMHPEWARDLRDQCERAGTPFLFKQWGEWKNGSDFASDSMVVLTDGRVIPHTRQGMEAADRADPITRLSPTAMRKVGKTKAGRTLDGKTYDGMPRFTP